MADEDEDTTPVQMVVMPVPLMAPFGVPLNSPDAVQEVWDTFIKPGQEEQRPQSIEDRMLMAMLRAVHAALSPEGPAKGLVPVPLEALKALVRQADEWRGQADAHYVSSDREKQGSDREFTAVVAALGIDGLTEE